MVWIRQYLQVKLIVIRISCINLGIAWAGFDPNIRDKWPRLSRLPDPTMRAI